MTEGRFPLTLEGIEKALEHSKSAESRREYIESLRARLAAFEERYKMPSELLREALASGKVKETADVAKWALAAESLEAIEKAGPRPPTS